MLCQRCHQNPAAVRLVDLPPGWIQGASGDDAAREEILCEPCAQNLGIPPPNSPKPSVSAIFKLLQISSKRPQNIPTCPDCGMSLIEFRQKGRLGCPKDYEVFREHLGELLDRVHGSNQHVGRLPGLDEEQLVRLRRRDQLERDLDDAIREEAYEKAARLRDELKSLAES